MERRDLVEQRINYLRNIKKKIEEWYSIIYLDETWVDSHTTPSRQWMPPNPLHAQKLPMNKGQRLVVLHAGCKEKGFLPWCDLVFKSKSTDGRDYHTEMNSTIFMDWTVNQLVPALPPKSLIVMDNASYHSVREEGTTAPTSSTRKPEMEQWLYNKHIPFDNKLTKPKLYEIIKANKPKPTYKIDEYLRRHGHEVLRLPPYHCELNPIEMIWGDLKCTIASGDKSFKLSDIKVLTSESLQKIDQSKWSRACDQVIEKVEKRYWKSDNIKPEIGPIVIQLSDSESEDSTTESESDTDSE